MMLSMLAVSVSLGLAFVGMALLIGLEIMLSSWEAVWPGLILPAVLASLGCLCYFKAPGYSPLWLLVLCLPALLVLALYLVCRRRLGQTPEKEG
ncbi:MAG: hypothetical protein HFF18_03145 [Oscillospiraceae bacterium]|nr:hypothetical protein [Oscillospiraceae bacterium]